MSSSLTSYRKSSGSDNANGYSIWDLILYGIWYRIWDLISLAIGYGAPPTTSSIRANHNMPAISSTDTHVDNVSNGYNTIVGVGEESSRIQAWLSPLEPHRKHQHLSGSRLAGIGDWFLHRTEFGSWSKGGDGSEIPNLLFYGGQGVGKTYIR